MHFMFLVQLTFVTCHGANKEGISFNTFLKLHFCISSLPHYSFVLHVAMLHYSVKSFCTGVTCRNIWFRLHLMQFQAECPIV